MIWQVALIVLINLLAAGYIYQRFTRKPSRRPSGKPDVSVDRLTRNK